MTALHQYQRLESPGLWRPAPEAQRREVIVLFRDATLVLSDPVTDRPLSHWSIPALRRTNPGKIPALYTPGPGPDESLEIEDDIMVAAIDKVHRIIAARRPHPGRVRTLLAIAVAAVIAGLAVFWLPGALVRHAASVAPQAKRAEIGRAVLAELETLTGPACRNPVAEQALSRLSRRLLDRPVKVAILPTVVTQARMLPGDMIVAGRGLANGPETPDALAGNLLAADLAGQARDPLLDVLGWAGVRAAFRLLTTGNLPEGALKGYGQALLDSAPPRPGVTLLVDRFTTAKIPTTPYAQGLDSADSRRDSLIEADPFADLTPDPVLRDAEWAALQTICD